MPYAGDRLLKPLFRPIFNVEDIFLVSWRIFYWSGSSPSTREDNLRVSDLINEFRSLEEHELKSFFSTLVNNQVRNFEFCSTSSVVES